VSDHQQAAGSATGEAIYFDSGDVIVTSARIVIGAKLYSVKHITSVQTVKLRNQARFWGIIIALFGVLIVLLGLPSFFYERGQGSSSGIGGCGCIVTGVIMSVTGVSLAVFSKTKYVVRLASASGEVDALKSPDKELIAAIVGAITKAITK